MFFIYEYTETRRNEPNNYLFIYIFTVNLTTPLEAQNIATSSKFISNYELENIRKDVALTPFLAPTRNSMRCLRKTTKIQSKTSGLSTFLTRSSSNTSYVT